MNRILFLLIFCTFSLSETILIPEDFGTIQEGIDASVDGDTVLVADGDYVENLVLDKSIVLTSYAIYDNLDEWIIFDDYYFNQWVINNSHIANTRLIGSSPDDPDYGSVILITPDSEECISPEIVGFTIQGGSGTNVLRQTDLGEEINVLLGGGILSDVSDPHIHHNAFENNGSEEVYSGGASQLTSSAEDWSFDNRFENYNPRCDVEEFRLSDNLYNGNDAQYGNTMANRFHEDEFDMSGSIFDVFDCGNEESAVSTIWVKVEPAASVDYDDGAGQLCAFTAPNVYVDSSIPQECLDEGCGFSNNPFKTIGRALEMINPSESNPITIHLAAGTYSPETGESFPINMVSNLNIEGEDEEATILDAMQMGRVITIMECSNNTISDLTITGGTIIEIDSWFSEMSGGGVYVEGSDPSLNNISIISNEAYYGGGLAIIGANFFGIDSTKITILTNVTMSENTAITGGGGIYFFNSSISLMYVSINNNVAGSTNATQGGGGMWGAQGLATLNYINIYSNIGYSGGGIFLENTNIDIDESFIQSNQSLGSGGGINSWGGNFYINNTLISNNSAESSGGGMSAGNGNGVINNTTLFDNMATLNGGGIYFYSTCSGSLTNMEIMYNTALGNGGGIYCTYNSNPNLTHINIHNNTAIYGGGIYTLSAPVLDHVNIVKNVSNFYGAGLLIDNIIDINSVPSITNSIIWYNFDVGDIMYQDPTAESISQFGQQANITISYSLIHGGWGMEECLAHAGDVNFSDSSFYCSTLNYDECITAINWGECWQWGFENNVIDLSPRFTNWISNDFILQNDSPCIDAGTADIDGDGIDDITDFIGSAPDMGAYEFGESSEIMAGDTNFDGIVDILDIVRIVNQIMGNSEFNDDEFTAADFNADGIVDILDIVQIVNYILAN